MAKSSQPAKDAGGAEHQKHKKRTKQLRAVVDNMDAFFAHSNGAAFHASVSPSVILHADLLTLHQDVSGADKVESALASYTKAFDYKHEKIAYGADIESGSVFHFWIHLV